MGKVFTITEGLENMGALKTGGQGSVYKGRRIGEIITAVKLLPTPIYSESGDDKNFTDFQNEVQKLKKVNETPNPNVVKILSSGITETGAFPFIEMEYIEGPDLEELLKEPHEPVFTLKEVIKVAEHLSCALSHCHKVDVKHGDIKSNNVKFNIHTGNYVLLDFGLAVMSDEQRRTSLRHAGAIEFMAPEQNEGKMLYQTDIYSFGVILYELLGGRVPFPLENRGETARNIVMVSHMEALPPDVLTLRQQNLPVSWSVEKQQHEMLVPEWLINMIYKCLAKSPEARFANGAELQDYITLNSTLVTNKQASGKVVVGSNTDHTNLINEKDQLQQTLLQYQQEIERRDKQLERLNASMLEKDSELIALRNNYNPATSRKGVSRGAFMALLFLTIGFGAVAAYSLFRQQAARRQAALVSSDQVDTFRNDEPFSVNTTTENTANRPVRETATATILPTVQDTATTSADQQEEPASASTEEETPQPSTAASNNKTGPRYTVVTKAYFHDEPNDSTRRPAYMIYAKDVVLEPLEERDGFIYVVFTNHQGQTSKGWLRKQDLKLLEE
jgi:serine/threonine protein kinase